MNPIIKEYFKKEKPEKCIYCQNCIPCHHKDKSSAFLYQSFCSEWCKGCYHSGREDWQIQEDITNLGFEKPAIIDRIETNRNKINMNYIRIAELKKSGYGKNSYDRPHDYYVENMFLQDEIDKDEAELKVVEDAIGKLIREKKINRMLVHKGYADEDLKVLSVNSATRIKNNMKFRNAFATVERSSY